MTNNPDNTELVSELQSELNSQLSNKKLSKSEFMQQVFELKLELLCEYKRTNPTETVYLTENNLNMAFNLYKNQLNL